MNPEISVIIPAYNTEKYIAKAIESVLQQTIDNLEIIVVDDASIDATAAIAKSFSDPRVKVLTNPENIGAAATRNRAIQQATGKWIALLDSDDWYAPERLTKLLAVADSQAADMVADDIHHINDGEDLPWSTLFTESEQKIDKTIQIDPAYFVKTHSIFGIGLTLGLTKPIIKREFLLDHKIEYDENIRLGQDFWFYIRCLGNGARFFVLPQPYYFYRSRIGGLTKGSQLARWEQYCQVSHFFLKQDFVQNNYELSEALSHRLKLIEDSKPYFKVLDTINKGNLWDIVTDIFHNPSFFGHFTKRLPKRLERRYKYYLKKVML
ncbi:glycosyltransferase family 2 protein [Nodularia harveyana UHCC-0300]|uniref:Glycosyltransferase family 2 protein n=1 Tax=Nodularia harveyana UHCC-0300 TaxID=2974287 RepID=A0ABU5U9P2_9CYAN|nr:glycosyltransferase family 2 protein [Nodularia harveyana]MEA5580244.1 glycosyltransferase family 2 protein [Nodularia harveyana UHCC-0300]